MQDFQFIGGYDRRARTGTLSAPDAHKMVKASQAKVSTPRKPKSRTIAEIKARAEQIGAKLEIENGYIYLTPPYSSEYFATDKKRAWSILDEIFLEIVKRKSSEEIATQAKQAKEMLFS
jgi:hypothetical protein